MTIFAFTKFWFFGWGRYTYTMKTLTIPATIINGSIVPSRSIPPAMLKKKNLSVTITMTDVPEFSEDVMMTPSNKRAYKKAMQDLAEGKNVITIPDDLSTDEFLSFLSKNAV
jgi:hypothetical protein